MTLEVEGKRIRVILSRKKGIHGNHVADVTVVSKLN